MTMRWNERQTSLNTWMAVVCSAAFLGASNYCNLEAFTAHLTRCHETHQSAATKDHDEESSIPTHHHDEGSVACCAAMQALATSKSEFNPASHLTWQLYPLAPHSLQWASFLAPSRAASGLSPPAREPTPARPFYRTTFASHAPPICLA